MRSWASSPSPPLVAFLPATIGDALEVVDAADAVDEGELGDEDPLSSSLARRGIGME